MILIQTQKIYIKRRLSNKYLNRKQVKKSENDSILLWKKTRDISNILEIPENILEENLEHHRLLTNENISLGLDELMDPILV